MKIMLYLLICCRHNDLPSMIRKNFANQFKKFNFTDITKIKEQLVGTSGVTHTDLTRIKQGKLGGQFWAAYASCDSLAKDAIRIHLEQLDVIKRILQMYPDDFQFVTKSNRILCF
jgi:membrane dipeptidase